MTSAKATPLYFLFACLFFVVGCLPTARSQPSARLTTAADTSQAAPAAQTTSLPLPPPPTPTTTPASILAYLRQGNLWFWEATTQREVQVTGAGNIHAFAWSPDGALLATYTGRDVCFLAAADGRTLACTPLPGAPTTQYKASSVIWSPQQDQLLIIQDTWWLVQVAQGQPTEITHFEDPQTWGAVWPGIEDPLSPAYTGQALFLNDGSLLGSAAHAYACGSGGCTHQLFRFNRETVRLEPFGGPALSSGGDQLHLSADGRLLINYGTFHVGCGMYTTRVTITDLTTGNGRSFAFEQEAFDELVFAPDGQQLLVAQGEGCGSLGQAVWSVSCGLSDAFAIYPLQLWDWQANSRETLLPGLEPEWSPDGRHIAFRSCLAQSPAGIWEPIHSGPPWLYILSFQTDGYVIVPVAIGQSPAWQP